MERARPRGRPEREEQMTAAGRTAEKTERIGIRDLAADDAAAFAGLTAPALRELLSPATLPPGVHRLGAFVDDRPAGLLLSCPAEAPFQELSSIMVAPEWRGRGVARALLDRLARRLEEEGCPGLLARWSDRLPRAREFAALLEASGWSAPVETRRRMTWRVGDWRRGFPTRDALLARLRAHGMVDRSLSELGEAGIEDFARQNAALVRAGRAPRWSLAEGWLDGADRDVSLVLTDRQGALFGWLACFHQPQFRRWFVPQGFVLAEKVPRGWLVGGIASLCLRLEDKAGPDALVIAQPPAGVSGGMEALLFRHFGAHAIHTDFLRESRILLRREGG